MYLWQKTLQAAIRIGAEWIEQDGTSEEQGWEGSAIPEPLHSQVCAWLEAFASQSLSTVGTDQRDKQLAIVKQLRAELALALAELSPAQAMALLCRLPNARPLGYASERLASALAVSEMELQAWERQAYAAIWQQLDRQEGKSADARMEPIGSDRRSEGERIQAEPVPLLHFLARQIAELEEAQAGFSDPQLEVHRGLPFTEMEAQKQVEPTLAEHNGDDIRMPPLLGQKEEEALLLQQAGQEAAFDLRAHVTAAKELEIRQFLHRFGLSEREQVKGYFPDEEQFAVDLVAERMALEMQMQGKGEATDADA